MACRIHAWTPLFTDPRNVPGLTRDEYATLAIEFWSMGYGDYLGCPCGAVAARSHHALRRVRVLPCVEDREARRRQARDWNARLEAPSPGPKRPGEVVDAAINHYLDHLEPETGA
jgi:hypothetical protein